MVDVAKGAVLANWWENDRLEIHNDDLFTHYRQWSQDENIRFIMEKKKFLMMMNNGNGKAGVQEGLKFDPKRFRLGGDAKLGIKTTKGELKQKIRDYMKDPDFQFGENILEEN